MTEGGGQGQQTKKFPWRDDYSDVTQRTCRDKADEGS